VLTNQKVGLTVYYKYAVNKEQQTVGMAENGDEDFKIMSTGIASLKYFRIFNRWVR
jgi:hypothetical protein